MINAIKFTLVDKEIAIETSTNDITNFTICRQNRFIRKLSELLSFHQILGIVLSN